MSKLQEPSLENISFVQYRPTVMTALNEN